jgi:trk system potassium uptake protein TrkH
MRSKKQAAPPFILVSSFALLILVGTILLKALPTRAGTHIPFIDSLFMVTSAVCVTGLSVIDIGSEFSTWQQLTLLGLIQFGGLGIMTFSTVFILALGRSISFRSRFIVQDVFSYSPQADLHVLLKRVFLFTLSFEMAGAILLFLRFREDFEPLTAAYHAMFNAVSAFCNAGFSLFSDSMMRYCDDPLVSLTISGLIITGGIGFMVLHELLRTGESRIARRHYWGQLSLHTKMVLAMTGLLLAAGTFFFLWSEWSWTLQGKPLPAKLLASFFQSVTPRTAGFNSLDYGLMNNLTLLGTIMLMFIGASPGSTGGGIKTTSMGVLLSLSRARMIGAEHPHAFRRTISPDSISRAFSIFVVSIAVVMAGTAGCIIAELGDAPPALSRGQFLELLFESASAFGTVGLSMGITPKLSSWSKLILVLLMFTGRLGPLVIAMAIQPMEMRGKFTYAEENLMIG